MTTLNAALTIIDVATDAALLGHVFGGASWSAWRALLKGIFALPLDADEVRLFLHLTGRTRPAAISAREVWLSIGRRGGKSMVMALVAVYLTCFRRYTLAPGERGVFMIVAPDRRQCRVIKGYISGLLKASALLKPLVARETKEGITLTTGVTIEVHTASFRTTRGYTVVGCIIDEGAFLPTDDSAEPDKELIGAIRPAMATVPGALLLFISSPYARRGELWRVYQKHFGKDDDPVFVAQAPTKLMNPTIPDHVIAAAYEQDDAVARAEYGAQFRSDVEGLFQRDAVTACVVSGRRELPPRAGVTYRGFTDPSGGSADSFTLAISHVEGTVTVLDAVRERKPPFSPDAVVQEFADLLKSYGLTTVQGDKYAGEWPRERFRVHGIHYEPATKSKSDLYLALLPLVNSARVELLDDDRLVNQLAALERRTARGGKDSVDHAPGSHDDRANAVAGALAQPVPEGPRIRIIDLDEDSVPANWHDRRVFPSDEWARRT